MGFYSGVFGLGGQVWDAIGQAEPMEALTGSWTKINFLYPPTPTVEVKTNMWSDVGAEQWEVYYKIIE